MKKLFLLITLLFIMPLLATGCDVSPEQYAHDGWWCKFYGNCGKTKHTCSFYGTCADESYKKDSGGHGCGIHGCKDTDDGDEEGGGDTSCSFYGNCPDDASDDDGYSDDCGIWGCADHKKDCGIWGC